MRPIGARADAANFQRERRGLDGSGGAAALATMAAAAEGFDSYYATLSISPTATDAEIKRAYRKAAIASHPDKGGGAEKFKAVAGPLEVLSDANKRAAYDRFGKAGLRGGGVAQRTWAPGQSPEDIFRQMFGDQADLAALFREMQAAAARGDGIHWQQSPAPKPQRLSPTPAPTSRAALERLTSDLQAEFFAEDVTPPATAVSWREAEIRAISSAAEQADGAAAPLDTQS